MRVEIYEDRHFDRAQLRWDERVRWESPNSTGKYFYVGYGKKHQLWVVAIFDFEEGPALDTLMKDLETMMRIRYGEESHERRSRDGEGVADGLDEGSV